MTRPVLLSIKDLSCPIPFPASPDRCRDQARIAGALGGRAAEQLVFGTNQVTTGEVGIAHWKFTGGVKI